MITEKIYPIMEEMIDVKHSMEDKDFPDDIIQEADDIVGKIENLIYLILEERE